MDTRPQIGETYADLLRLAATVASAKPYHNEETHMEQDIVAQLSNTIEQIPENSNIGMIVEKNPTYSEPIPHTFSQKTGSPTARRRDLREKKTVPITQGSILLQQMKVDNTSAQTLEPVKPEEHFPFARFIETGVDRQHTHEENSFTYGFSDGSYDNDVRRVTGTVPDEFTLPKAERWIFHDQLACIIKKRNPYEEARLKVKMICKWIETGYYYSVRHNLFSS